MDHAHATPVAFAVPAVLYVAGGAPEVADVFGPQPRFGRAPLADAENDRASGFEQRVTHDRIRGGCVLRAGRAPVVLQIVDVPRRALACVLKLVAATAWTFLTSEGARVGVETKLQAFRMNVVREGFHAGGKSLRIGLDVALRVAIDLPAVVDHEIDVTGVAHAARDHRVGHVLDQLFADVAGKLVPTVPAHRRGFSETIVVRAGAGPAAGDEEDNSDQCFHSCLCERDVSRKATKENPKAQSAAAFLRFSLCLCGFLCVFV